MEKVLDTESMELIVYPKKKIIHHRIKDYIYGETFKTLFSKGVEEFEKYGCTKWLSDDRGSAALRREDVEWAQTNWEDKILDKGWKYWAVVMPEKFMGQMTMKPIIERNEKMGLAVEVFNDPFDAMDWLERQ